MTSENPTCAKCGLPMTRENARLHPEFFLHDECLPAEYRTSETPTEDHRQALGRAEAVLAHYRPQYHQDIGAALVDVLADLAHFSETNGRRFSKVVERALMHYRGECEGDEHTTPEE